MEAGPAPINATRLPFFGADLWTAFELSWLNLRGKPQVAIAHFTVPCESTHIVESKSIDFDTLPHLAACALFDAVADTIEAETGLKVDQIMPPLRQHAGLKRELLAEVHDAVCA